MLSGMRWASAVVLSVFSAAVAAFTGWTLTGPPALARFGHLFSARTWRALEAIAFLALFAMTAIGRARAGSRARRD